MLTKNHLNWVIYWALVLVVAGCQAQEKPEALTGEIECAKSKKVLDVANLKTVDVAVEYWATGTCRASFVPAGGDTTGQNSPEAKGGGEKKEGPHKTQLFKNVSSLTFSCIEGTGGKCYYKILKAVASGQGENTHVESAENDKSLACPKKTEENPLPILEKAHDVCDVTVKGSGSKEGCKAVIFPDDGAKEDAPAEYTTFVGVTKGFVLRCDGGYGGDGCHFSYSIACRKK
jgi:hypothetical protein